MGIEFPHTPHRPTDTQGPPPITSVEWNSGPQKIFGTTIALKGIKFCD